MNWIGYQFPQLLQSTSHAGQSQSVAPPVLSSHPRRCHCLPTPKAQNLKTAAQGEAPILAEVFLPQAEWHACILCSGSLHPRDRRGLAPKSLQDKPRAWLPTCPCRIHHWVNMKTDLVFHARSLLSTMCQPVTPAACLSQCLPFCGTAAPSTSLPKGEIKGERESERQRR